MEAEEGNSLRSRKYHPPPHLAREGVGKRHIAAQGRCLFSAHQPIHTRRRRRLHRIPTPSPSLCFACVCVVRPSPPSDLRIKNGCSPPSLPPLAFYLPPLPPSPPPPPAISSSLFPFTSSDPKTVFFLLQPLVRFAVREKGALSSAHTLPHSLFQH